MATRRRKWCIASIAMGVTLVLIAWGGWEVIVTLRYMTGDNESRVIALCAVEQLDSDAPTFMDDQRNVDYKGLLAIDRLSVVFAAAVSREYSHIHRAGRMLDPWGRPYRVTCSRDGTRITVSVRSAGADGNLRTDDDIVNSRCMRIPPTHAQEGAFPGHHRGNQENQGQPPIRSSPQ